MFVNSTSVKSVKNANIPLVDSVISGQLILGKVAKIGATRCQILSLKCTKFAFQWGSAPDPTGDIYSPATSP